MPSVLAPYDTATGYLSGRSGVKSIGLAAGMTGATASSRYVGATASGAPTTGTFAVGDWIIDQTGKIYVATVAGSPGTWVQVGAGGGGGASITQVTFAEATAAPNATIYVDSITAAGSTTNVDLALSPKGTGALTAQVADSTTAGGNKRGANAVDWQTARGVATQVASNSGTTIAGGSSSTAAGQGSFIGGGYANATATGTYGVIGGGYTNNTVDSYPVVSGGQNNTASALAASVGGGYLNTASAYYSTVPGGSSAIAAIYGKFAYASGRFAANGDAQFGLNVCRATTTTNAAVNLVNDGTGTFSATNHLVLPNNRVYRFTVDLVASSGTIGTASTTTYGSFGGVWTITGAIRRAATEATTAIIGTPTVLATAVDSQLAAVTFTVLAETATYGSLQIVATGLASTQIHWVATIMTTEVG